MIICGGSNRFSSFSSAPLQGTEGKGYLTIFFYSFSLVRGLKPTAIKIEPLTRLARGFASLPGGLRTPARLSLRYRLSFLCALCVLCGLKFLRRATRPRTGLNRVCLLVLVPLAGEDACGRRGRRPSEAQSDQRERFQYVSRGSADWERRLAARVRTTCKQLSISALRNY